MINNGSDSTYRLRNTSITCNFNKFSKYFRNCLTMNLGYPCSMQTYKEYICQRIYLSIWLFQNFCKPNIYYHNVSLPFLYKLSLRNPSLSSVRGTPADGSRPGGTMMDDEGNKSWVQLRPGSGRLGSSWSSECTGGTRGGDEGDEGG